MRTYLSSVARGGAQRPGAARVRRRALPSYAWHASALVGLGCALLAAPAAYAGEIRGEIKFEPNRLGESPVRHPGFIERIENPLLPVKQLDPWPYFVIVLEGGPMTDADKAPSTRTVRYQLLGETFATPVLPVVAGSEMEIRNFGPTMTLFTPEYPELLDSVTIERTRGHPLRVKEPYRVVVIRAQESIHLEGRVLAIPHRFFAKVDERGNFSLSNVPEGAWTVRVWHRDRWIEDADTKIEVGRRRADITIKLSPHQVREPAPTPTDK